MRHRLWTEGICNVVTIRRLDGFFTLSKAVLVS